MLTCQASTQQPYSEWISMNQWASESVGQQVIETLLDWEVIRIEVSFNFHSSPSTGADSAPWAEQIPPPWEMFFGSMELGFLFHSRESSPFGIIWIYLVCQTLDYADKHIWLPRKWTACSDGNCKFIEGTTRLLDDVPSVLWMYGIVWYEA